MCPCTCTIARRACSSSLKNSWEIAGQKLSAGQRHAVQVATTSPVLVLTGGPGCGKTSTVAAIVKLWSAMQKDMKLAAPTGVLHLSFGRLSSSFRDNVDLFEVA